MGKHYLGLGLKTICFIGAVFLAGCPFDWGNDEAETDRPFAHRDTLEYDSQQNAQGFTHGVGRLMGAFQPIDIGVVKVDDQLSLLTQTLPGLSGMLDFRRQNRNKLTTWGAKMYLATVEDVQPRDWPGGGDDVGATVKHQNQQYHPDSAASFVFVLYTCNTFSQSPYNWYPDTIEDVIDMATLHEMGHFAGYFSDDLNHPVSEGISCPMQAVSTSGNQFVGLTRDVYHYCGSHSTLIKNENNRW